MNELSRLQLLFEAAQDIILFLDGEGRIIDANQKAVESYGYTQAELLTMTILDLRHPSTWPAFQGQMARSESGGIVFESAHVRKDGSVFPVEVSSRSLPIDGKMTRIHIIRDISERKESEARISYLANFDALTGLPNRASIIESLQNAWTDSGVLDESFAVMVIDLDKFKNINDYYGHLTGDAVLKEAARRFERALRREDCVGRYGGDEFLLVQKSIGGKEDVLVLIRRIFAEFERCFDDCGSPIYFYLSVGISLYPHDSREQDRLISHADKAMYEAKKSAGNSYCFYDEIPS